MPETFDHQGLQDTASSFPEMILRAVVIYCASVAIVRILGGGRFLGKHAAFDVILGVIFGSMISRPVNATAPFLETIAVGTLLVGIHWVFGAIAVRSHLFGNMIKGNPSLLVKDGIIQWEAMRRNHFSERDLQEILRLHGMEEPKEVKKATLERNGAVSIVPGRRAGKLIDIKVEAGVQTVRIEIL